MTPLMNRALQGQYPPGSVFKIIVAAAGLQEGSLTPMDRIYCNGEFTLGNWTFKDWKAGGHGHVDLRTAIAQSCDIFFYQAGLKVGRRHDGPVRAGLRPGLAHRHRPGRRAVRAGAVLAGASAQRAKWQAAGDTVNMSIGQGQLLVTPLQVARMMAAVANGGVLWKPRLVQRVERADGTLAYALVEQDDGARGPLPGGLGIPAPRPGRGGQGGHRGVGARARRRRSRARPAPRRPSPRATPPRGRTTRGSPPSPPPTIPQCVVVVLVERGGKGGEVAAPIARQIYEAIFLQKVAR